MLNTLQFRLTKRYISRRLLQSILFILGIALGVAVGVAIDLANTSASRAFDLSVGSVTGRTTHQIVGSSGRLPTDVYRILRVDLGIRSSTPIIDTEARAISLNDRTLRLFGVDPFADVPFRDYLINKETNAEDINRLYNFIVRPRSVLISSTMADTYSLKPGDTITLQTNTMPKVDVTVVGVLYPSDSLSAQALDNLLLMDIATAQEIAGLPETITRIDLILPPDFDIQTIKAALPQGVAITTPSNSQSALSQMTDAFELNLMALSLLALLVGVFLIYNTVTISVVQRRPIIGILRSLGMTRRQVFSLVLTEALVLGTIGTVLGLGLGIVLGQGTVRLVAQTINDLYFRVNVESLTLEPITFFRGAAIGIAASIVAALIPSWEATRTQPISVMRRSSVEQGMGRILPFITGGAILIGALGYLILRMETTNVMVSFIALFMVLIGCALLTPLVMLALMHIVTPIMGYLFGVLGRMAPRAIARSISRTSVAVAALTLAVSVIVGVSVMISSFRSTLTDWLETTFGADIYISPYSNNGESIALDIDPAIVNDLTKLDGVARVATVRSVSVIAPDFPDLPPVNLSVATVDIANGNRRFAWLDAPNGDYWSALEAGQVFVSEPFAFRRGITPEYNTITLLTDRGEQPFTVAGVYYDYTADQGVVFMYSHIYQQFFDDPFLSAIALDLLPTATLDDVVNTLQAKTLVGMGLEAQSNRSLRENVLAIFDRTFAITIALRLLAMVVAFIGILSTLLALQLENTHQYGVMRANGMTPRQLRISTFLQTGLMGLTAGILALPIGLILSLILIYVINVRSFGWTMTLNLDYREFLLAFIVALIAALAAGIYPAWRSSKLIIAQALRGE